MTPRKSNVYKAAVAAAAIAMCAGPFSARAAVTVLGAGPAQLCYDGAENGGDPSDYITFCTQALNGMLSPRDRAATFINRGVLRIALNETTFAFDDFNAGLALDPNLGEGYIDRGVALIEKKRFSDALQDIDKGIGLGAKRPALAYYDRAIADEALGNITAAYRDYQQALTDQPDFTRASDELKRFKLVKSVGS